jgi:predicted TIM-barrel fold metal-dependent hydrolase
MTPDRTTPDRSIPFIETHHHLWELDRFPYNWLAEPGLAPMTQRLGEYDLIRVNWGPERLRREFYGQNVIKTIHVEADYSGPDPVEETAWLEAVAAEHGFPNGLVVFCNTDDSAAAAVLERHLVASSRLRGVRNREHPTEPSPAFLANYRRLGELGLSYELNASPGRLLAGRDVAAANPDTQMIVGHAGFPTRRDPAYFETWRTEMHELGRLPQVACKVSGLGMIDHDWTVDSLRPWVLECIEAFGPERAMFGTNWPVDILFATYLEQVDAWRTIIAEAGFSRADQEAMLFRNAERIYRI